MGLGFRVKLKNLNKNLVFWDELGSGCILSKEYLEVHDTWYGYKVRSPAKA